MKRLAFSLLVALILSTAFANAEVLFYGGDFNPSFWYSDSLSNENDAYVQGNPYGSAVYQNFVIPAGQTWNVTALFSNDIMTISPTSAYWEVRTGISEGKGGTLLSSGAGSDSYHLKGQFDEYTNTVAGLNLTLGPGMYWFTVVPEALNQQGRAYNTNTFGANSVGTEISDEQYLNSPYFAYNFTNADNLSIFPIFSSGVIGTAVPEPSSLILLGTAVLAMVGAVRRSRRL